MDKNKITIFWIEDNPIIGTNDLIEGKEYPKLLHQDLFSYCIFQHPMQVKEYLEMVNKLNGNKAYLSKECQKVLPDIVVFDYKLAQAIFGDNAGLDYDDADHYAYLKELSASHLLKTTFENLFDDKELFLDTEVVKKNEYREDQFESELGIYPLRDDEFGLYCGIAIVREFKEYITVGVPATIHKTEKASTMNYNSLFYEWINSYDLKEAINRPEKPDEMKDWSKILKFSLDLLRKRIVTQIQAGKATPNYSQLCALAEGDIPDERIFSFKTIYGKRDLPLDGLFIDVTDPIERNTKITEWVSEILNILPVENAVIKKARQTAKTLWDTYLNDFEDRIVLSDYSSRINSLNTTETAYLEEVKIKLGVNPTTNLIANERSIQTLLINKRTTDVNIIRLTALITLAGATIELEKQRIESNFSEKYTSFTKYEYLDILYPKANFKEPLLLSLNVETDKDDFTEQARTWLSNNLTTDSQNKIKIGDIFKFENWISKGEKEILKSLFYKDSEYFPQWFK